MTKAEETKIVVKGMISELSETDRKTVMTAYKVMRTMVDDAPLSALAVLLLAAEEMEKMQ
jgi:hypothetical protein